jgi:hypothetical protein
VGPNKRIYFSHKQNPALTRYDVPEDMKDGFDGSCYDSGAQAVGGSECEDFSDSEESDSEHVPAAAAASTAPATGGAAGDGAAPPTPPTPPPPPPSEAAPEVVVNSAPPTSKTHAGDQSGDVLDDSDSDDDIPLKDRVKSGDQSDASDDSDIPLIARVKPSVRRGDVVEVYWKEQNYEGWYEGTVEVISDGSINAPHSRKRKVPSGHSIVNYGPGREGGRFDHLLDATTHASRSRQGDTEPRAGSWRLAATGAKAHKPPQRTTQEVDMDSGQSDVVSKRRAIGGAAPACIAQPEVWCDPCGIGAAEQTLKCCSNCRCAHRCIECLRTNDTAGAWWCDECMAKKLNPSPPCNTANLLPYDKCLFCQTKCNMQISTVIPGDPDEVSTESEPEEGEQVVSEPSNHIVCINCRSCLCHDCACTLEGDDKQQSLIPCECWVCSGIVEFEKKQGQRIHALQSQLSPSVDLKTPAAAKKADKFCLLLYRFRMNAFYKLVKKGLSCMIRLLKQQARHCATSIRAPLPSLTPSQFNNMLLLHSDLNCDLFKQISLAYSSSANLEAKYLLETATASGKLKPLEPIPTPETRMRLGLVIGDATRHPLIDLYFGTIKELLEIQDVAVVLLLAGDVDTSHDPVKILLEEAESKGTVVYMGHVTAENRVEVLLKAREQRLHGCLDLIGSAHGELRSVITAGVALMQCHHLNYPNPQYPVDGKGNTHMISDKVLFAPHSEQVRIGGHEGMVTVSCWMPPLVPNDSNVSDKPFSRKSFDLHPEKLYLVFVALNSKLDPGSVELFVGALQKTASDVNLWILSYPAIGAINFIDSMKRHKSWKPEFESRVARGQHLPKDLHLARLAAFGNNGRGAIFLNFCLTYPGHTTLQEAFCQGILAIGLLPTGAACQQRAAASLMNNLGLGDFVANNENDALGLLEFLSCRDQDAMRLQMARALRGEFHRQEGFWNQKWLAAELLNGFRQIASNSRQEFPNGDQVSRKHVDARLSNTFTSATDRSPDPGRAWKRLIPLEPSSMLQLLMIEIGKHKKFDEAQMPKVFDILCLLLKNKKLPEKVIGVGGFCMAIQCASAARSESDVLKLEYHQVFITGDEDNAYNSEILRAVNGEEHFKKRIGRIRGVRIAENPETEGDFRHPLGFTKPQRGSSEIASEVVVFNYRQFLPTQLRDSMKPEFDKFREFGELGDSVRILQQVLVNGLGQLNANGHISLMDVSPSNIFFDGDNILENHQNTIVLSDMGGAAVHQLPGEISRFPQPMMRRHSTAADPLKHKRVKPVRVKPNLKGTPRAKKILDGVTDRHIASSDLEGAPKSPAATAKSDPGFTFWGSDRVMRVFQKRAEKEGALNSIRQRTPPFADNAVRDLELTADLGAHIDRYAAVRIFLYYLAPKKSKESIEDWDKAARRASGSTIEMGAFIANRMSKNLQQDHPRQPLMWQRLLDFLVAGLAPWPTQVTLLALTTSLFLSTPFLAPEDDRNLAAGGFISAPGGPLYGDIHPKLVGKSIKSVEIRLIPGKGVGAVAGEDMAEGDVAGIYVCSCVPRNDQGIDSRYAIRCPEAEPRVSEPLIYVARFTPKMSVRWYIDRKKSTGAFFNAPSPGERVNCKLERLLGWNDDKDTDLGQALKIFPILACVAIKKGKEITWPYDPNAGQGDAFPIY